MAIGCGSLVDIGGQHTVGFSVFFCAVLSSASLRTGHGVPIGLL
jgi:hypothetical protein